MPKSPCAPCAMRREIRSSPRRRSAARRGVAAARAGLGRKSAPRQHQVHVARDRLDDHARRCSRRCARNACSTAAMSLYGEHQRVVGDLSAARRRRSACRRSARPSPPSPAGVAVAVVAALELDDLRPRPVKPRASRSALIVASVPDDTSRTCSIDGRRRMSSSAMLDLELGGRAERQPARAPSLHRPRRPPGGRGRGSAGPRSRRSRYSASRRRPKVRALRRARRSAACRPPPGTRAPASSRRRGWPAARAKSSSLRSCARLSKTGPQCARAARVIIAGSSCAPKTAPMTATVSAPAAISDARIARRDATDRDDRNADGRGAHQQRGSARRAAGFVADANKLPNAT